LGPPVLTREEQQAERVPQAPVLVNGDRSDGRATFDVSINGGHGWDTFNFTDGVSVVDAEAQ
jgi:hypothetical protein